MTTTVDACDDLMSAYLRHWKSLRSLLRKRTGSHELADDALQETWIRLASMNPPATTVQDHQAYLLRLAGNIATDLFRKERRHSSRCINDEDLLAAVQDRCPSPEVFAIDRDQLRQLVLALSQLPTKPRAALLLSRCDGRSHAEIAAQLKVSESMVAKYLVQALCHCRDYLRAIG